MPWGAVVELVRLELRGSGWGARGCCRRRRRAFVYAAYGDSITHGWCGATPYPELVAARHGWQSVNLGIPGMGAVGGAHGAAIAAVGAQLVSVAIGINDIFWCGAVGEPLRQTLVGIRARQPRVPLVVVTPTPSYMDGKRCTRPDGGGETREGIREQVREAVRARVARRRQRRAPRRGADARALLDARRGPPPRSGRHGAARRQPQRADGSLAADARRPDVPVARRRARRPRRRAAGSRSSTAAARRIVEAPAYELKGDMVGACGGTVLMLRPLRYFEGTADGGGRATLRPGDGGATDTHGCEDALVQALDLSSCTLRAPRAGGGRRGPRAARRRHRRRAHRRRPPAAADAPPAAAVAAAARAVAAAAARTAAAAAALAAAAAEEGSDRPGRRRRPRPPPPAAAAAAAAGRRHVRAARRAREPRVGPPAKPVLRSLGRRRRSVHRRLHHARRRQLLAV